jgi:hypothetical protein
MGRKLVEATKACRMRRNRGEFRTDFFRAALRVLATLFFFVVLAAG